MTVIAVVIGEDEMYAAADSISIVRETGQRYIAPPKIWRHPVGTDGSLGEVLLGFAGTLDLTTRVKLGLKIESLPNPDDELDCWQWADRIATAVWELATGATGPHDIRDVDKAPGFEGILGWAGQLYVLSSYGNAQPIVGRTYAAIGSGEDIAHGVMWACSQIANSAAPAVVQMAVTAACAHNSGCGPPVVTQSLPHHQETRA